ncbi:hypothetical protein Plec18170_008688 [Paecilomyces lecythidis]
MACPYHLLKRAGLLGADIVEKFDQLKDNPELAERFIQAQNHPGHQKRDTLIGPRDTTGNLDLPLGGGLLNGHLQPLTGLLSGFLLPIPQPIGLKEIPGDDPDHQFQPPGPHDVRGTCPASNALANYGYLNRSGITTFAEVANAFQTGFGFGFDLSVFLSALALLAGGDLLTGIYSIGGEDARVPNTLGPAPGMSSHGVFEIDGSITREDTYFGNNANFILQRWDEYVEIANRHGGQFGWETNGEDNGYRYDLSRETNPEFYAGALWFAVSHAERVFVWEGFANGTDQNADWNNIAPFFLNETFPPNWYRRGTPFSIPQAFGEAGLLFLSNPRILGGNEGSVDNFVPLPSAVNFTQLAGDPAELGCWLVENILDVAPGQVRGAIRENFDLYQGFLKGVVLPFFTDDGFFNCNFTGFFEPGNSEGEEPARGLSSDGSPVNGAYPGIGVIKPHSEPS